MEILPFEIAVVEALSSFEHEGAAPPEVLAATGDNHLLRLRWTDSWTLPPILAKPPPDAQGRLCCSYYYYC